MPLEKKTLQPLTVFFRLNGTAGGVCDCSPGWVPWKWECHPEAALGEPCVTSTQCQAKVGHPPPLFDSWNSITSKTINFIPFDQLKLELRFTLGIYVEDDMK